MANIKDQKSAVEETLSTQEAFFAKNKKAIIYGVLAVVVIIAGIIVYNTYVSAPREPRDSNSSEKSSSRRHLTETRQDSRDSFQWQANTEALMQETSQISMQAFAMLTSANGMRQRSTSRSSTQRVTS